MKKGDVVWVVAPLPQYAGGNKPDAQQGIVQSVGRYVTMIVYGYRQRIELRDAFTTREAAIQNWIDRVRHEATRTNSISADLNKSADDAQRELTPSRYQPRSAAALEVKVAPGRALPLMCVTLEELNALADALDQYISNAVEIEDAEEPPAALKAMERLRDEIDAIRVRAAEPQQERNRTMKWINSPRLTWSRCSRCRGSLPQVDTDNGHRLLPSARTPDGMCSGEQTPAGRCGCYRDATVDAWLREDAAP